MTLHGEDSPKLVEFREGTVQLEIDVEGDDFEEALRTAETEDPQPVTTTTELPCLTAVMAELFES